MHIVRRNDVYENIGWMTSLRGDRDERNLKSDSAKKKMLDNKKAK